MVYERYAPLYDNSGQIRFALLTADYLREVLKRHPITGRHALDLACGTGTLALLLAEEGWHVIGIDSSAAMLAQAQAKRAQAELAGSVHFIQHDMRYAADVTPAGACHLVTCTYDSLNYMLTAADLAACFAAAAHALAPGGIFVGDMNTRHFLEYDWGTCAIHEQPGYVQIERSSFDPEQALSTMLLTGFAGNDRDGYIRFDETHCERAYPTEAVDALFQSAGLMIEAHYDSFTFAAPGPKSQRIFWVARKPAQPATEHAYQ
jgi:SAM-dependent methyltransferase